MRSLRRKRICFGNGAGCFSAGCSVLGLGAVEWRVRTVTIPVLLAAFVIAHGGCTSGPQPMDDTSHDQDTLTWRASKDAMFRSETDSPIPAADRAGFRGLPYYPIDSAY